jgi:hypothetical protein
MSIVPNIALKTAGKHGIYQRMHQDGDTQDIINTVLWADKRPEHKTDTAHLAPKLRTFSEIQTAYNCWEFVRKNIKYILDPLGEQYIKAPNKTLSDGFGDCKSRTLLMTSLLDNCGIRYGYRFAGYQANKPVGHVYALAYIGGKTFVLDADMVNFNVEKEYKKHTDYMSQISYIGNTGKKEGMLDLYLSPEKMTDLDMEIAIRKQRDEINKNILEGIAGIGCPHAEKVQDRIDAYNDVIDVRQSAAPIEIQKSQIGLIAEDFAYGAYNNADIAGIGDIGARKAKRAERKAVRKVARVKRKAEGKTTGQRLKKGIKKIAKKALKIATAPARIPTKAVLEVLLPKAAPFFIYLFVTKPELIAKLPREAAIKRKKADAIRKFIVNTIGMKEAHFMGIVRNGIMKRYKKSPEQVLSLWLGYNVSGIGILPAALIPVVLQIIQKIAKAFGKKKEGKELESTLSEKDNPDPKKDFASMSDTDRKSFASNVKKQPIEAQDKSVTEQDTDNAQGGGNSSTDDAPNAGARNNRIC